MRFWHGMIELILASSSVERSWILRLLVRNCIIVQYLPLIILLGLIFSLRILRIRKWLLRLVLILSFATLLKEWCYGSLHSLSDATSLRKPVLKIIKGKWSPLSLYDVIAGIDVVMIDRVCKRCHHRARKAPAKAASYNSAESPDVILIELVFFRLVAYAWDNMIAIVH